MQRGPLETVVDNPLQNTTFAATFVFYAKSAFFAPGQTQVCLLPITNLHNDAGNRGVRSRGLNMPGQLCRFCRVVGVGGKLQSP
jgi:hypothetical protein